MAKRRLFDNSLPDSALRYVLESVVPYTRANVELAFKPNQFFNSLEAIDRRRRYARSTLRNAYYRALEHGFIVLEGSKITLTEKGSASLQPFVPTKLKRSHILVIFDIPEADRRKRQTFRLLLRELKFHQVQKSVWMSDYECREILAAEVAHLRISKYVEVFEAVNLKLSAWGLDRIR